MDDYSLEKIKTALEKRSRGITSSSIAQPSLKKKDPSKKIKPSTRKEGLQQRKNKILSQSDVLSTLEKIFGKYKNFSYEIEASFGILDKKLSRFIPGLSSPEYFNTLKKRLFSDSNFQFDDYIERRVDIPETGNVRRVVILSSEEDDLASDQDPVTGQNANILYEQKKTIENHDWDMYGVRFRVSQEKYIRELPEEWKRNFSRYQQRYTFVVNDPKSPYYGVQIDMSRVTERGRVKYEVEIERAKVEQKDYKNFHKRFISAVRYIYDLSLFGEPMTIPDRKNVIRSFNNLIGKPTMAYKVLRINGGFENRPINLKIKEILSADPYVTIKTDGIRMFLYLDHNRLIFSQPLSNFVFAIKWNSNKYIDQVLSNSKKEKDDKTKYQIVNSLIDGELRTFQQEGNKVKIVFDAFDLLFHGDLDVRDRYFEERYERLNRIGNLQFISTDDIDFEYSIKQYFSPKENNFYENSSKALDLLDEENTDGIIYQPLGVYKNSNTFKWKPEDKMTIDFSLSPLLEEEIEKLNLDPEKDYWWMLVYGSNYYKDGNLYYNITKNGNIVQVEYREIPKNDKTYIPRKENYFDLKRKLMYFYGTKDHPFRGYSEMQKLYLNEISGKIVDEKDDKLAFVEEPREGIVYECQYVYDENTNIGNFIPNRIRDDKDKPNFITPAIEVWKDINNPITTDTITGNNLKVMRKYHNHIKQEILNNELPINSTILDIGSGRGGDLMKWEQARVKNVVVVEPNNTNLKELNRRKPLNYNPNLHIINGGAESSVLIKNVLEGENLTLDATVAFFSLTFFFEDKSKLKSLINTIDLLPDRGKFIGIVMDGLKVEELLNKVREEENIPPNEGSYYDTESFVIEQINKFKDRCCGNKIEVEINDSDSMVKDKYEEYLFYFNYFEKYMREKGFVLLNQGFLNDGDMFDHLSKDAKTFSSLNRVFVFQKRNVTVPISIDLLKKNEKKKLANPYGEKLFYTGVKDSPLNFTDSVEYSSKKKIDRTKIKLSTSKFKTLNAGDLYKELEKRQKEISDGSVSAYKDFKSRLENKNEWMGELQLTQLISEDINVNIFVLNFDGKRLKCSDLLSKNKKSVFKPNRDSVILVTADNIHYQPVLRQKGKIYERIFKAGDSLIEKLLNEI